MLEATLVKASLFKKVVDAMKELVNDATFEFSDTGIRLQAMDSSHVSLCALNLQKDGFDNYRCDKSKSVSLKLQNLGKVLRCADNEDSLAIKAKDDSDVITLLIESTDKNSIKDFDLKLMDLDMDQLEIPETEYQTEIQINANEFRKIIGDLMALDDTCTITAKKDAVTFTVDGDLGKANFVLKQGTAADDDKQTKISVEDPVTLRFALRYLNSFTKATPLSDMVCLKLSADVPLLVEYKIEAFGSISYFLAPKIEEEEDA